MANKVPLVILITIVMGVGFFYPRQTFAAIKQQDAKTLRNLTQDMVSYDVGNFVEHFYETKPGLFIFLNDEPWNIERLQNGVYLISVHIESYEKPGEPPLGRDILTIKVDPEKLNQLFRNPSLTPDEHGIHIVHCQHQAAHFNNHHITFARPREIKGKFCR